MRLVTPTTKGDVLLRVGENLQQIRGAQLDELFTLRVYLPCEKLLSGGTLYWATAGHEMISASIPPQFCDYKNQVPAPSVDFPVQVLNKKGKCWIDTGNHTLWRVATEVRKLYGATVYQVVYGIFIANRGAFSGEDINRLKVRVLQCPSPQQIESIPAQEAQRMFKEMLDFTTSPPKKQ